MSSDLCRSTESCHVTLLRYLGDCFLEEMSWLLKNVLSFLDKEDFGEGEGEHEGVGVTGGVRRNEVPMKGVGDVAVGTSPGTVRSTEEVVDGTGVLEGLGGEVGTVSRGLQFVLEETVALYINKALGCTCLLMVG